MKTALLAGLMAAAMIAPACAQTGADETRGPYVGFGVTHSEHEWMSGKKNNLRLFGGWDFSERWGVELGTSRQGSFTSHYNYGDGVPTLMGSFKGRDTYLAGKLTLPVTDKLALQTKLGVMHSRGDFMFVTSGVPGPYQESASNNGLYAGVGLKYKISPRVSLSLDLERTGKPAQGGPKNEAVTVGASYKF